MGFIKIVIGRFEILSEIEIMKIYVNNLLSTFPFLGSRLRDCQSHHHTFYRRTCFPSAADQN